jgi:hypothetical protein
MVIGFSGYAASALPEANAAITASMDFFNSVSPSVKKYAAIIYAIVAGAAYACPGH